MARSPLVDHLGKLWRTLLKKGVLKKDQRQIQLEADVHRLFLATGYNHFNRKTFVKDADEICDLAAELSFADQLSQVQENVHTQIQEICQAMNDILKEDNENSESILERALSKQTGHHSGLCFAVGGKKTIPEKDVVCASRSIGKLELSNAMKERIGYTLELKQSDIFHEEAGQGLFLNGKAMVGAVIAFYPGIIYSPSYYRFIPGYPRVDAANPYLISRYDGIVIDAQPWGTGGEAREVWSGLFDNKIARLHTSEKMGKSDKFWEMLSKPQENTSLVRPAVVELRNPLALGHYANHPAKGKKPNVMVCPYNFPLSDMGMRPYIPNLVVGNEEEVLMERYGSIWLRPSSARVNASSIQPTIRTLVLIAIKELCDEEIFLNYRLSNVKRQPIWYHPVDEEEDRRRWS